MGMSSSQARLLNLTARMHQIEYKAAKLEAMKLQMANESKRVYEDYLLALEATKIQYRSITDDAAITFLDANYYNLCFGYAGDRYALVSPSTDEVYVTEGIYDAFTHNPSSPADFATELTGYTPPAAPTSASPTVVYNEPEVTPQEDTTDISLVRKDASQNAASETITAGHSINLTLSNLIGSASTYGYTITTLNPSQDADISVQYLDNGRLVINGSNLKITANGGQKDDIILLGSNNELNTQDGDDIVRIAEARDSSGIFSGYSTNNVVNTGSGTDHVTVYNSGNRVIDGDGVNMLFSSTSVKNGTNTSSANVTSSVNTSSNNGITSQSADTIEGTSAQVSANDCRLFSLINSLGRTTNNGNLSNYVTITTTGSGYNVKFKNYSGSGANNINVTNAEIEGYTGVTGDLTTTLIDYAINKLMYQNRDDSHLSSSATTPTNAFSRADYQTVSKYFFGNTNFRMFVSSWGEDVVAGLKNLWRDYSTNSNGVTNLLVGFKSSNPGLGIYSSHAYAVKNLVLNSDNSINYIEVVNPWDDADIIRLDGDTLSAYVDDCYTFGSSHYNLPITIANVESASNDEENPFIALVHNSTPQEDEWYYYYNLHNEIQKHGLILISDANAMSTQWLANVINNGFAYLKVLDTKTETLIGASVATSTALREVDDKTLLKKAEAKYEADMKRIDMKDRKYDSDLAALETERNAIKQEIDTLKTVAKENVERTFKLFS